MKFKNLVLALRDRLPLINLLKKDLWRMFNKESHISFRSGNPKVKYNTKKTADKSAKHMTEKKSVDFSSYKCVYCDGYHIGKTTIK